jgi:hypothetical protein
MAEETTKKTLQINCGLACLLRDREGILDHYDEVRINCGTLIASAELSLKLSARGAKINTGNLRVQNFHGEILCLNQGTVIDDQAGTAGYKDLFVIAEGDLVIRGRGLKSLSEAEGVLTLGTCYYPRSSEPAWLAKISGNKRAYPDDALLLLEDLTLEEALAAAPGDAKHIWVSGEVDARDGKILEAAHARGLTISCASLFTYEGLNASWGTLFKAEKRTLIPDGCEVTGDLSALDFPLYGSRVYVRGDFRMAEKDLPLLENMERIIVKGTAFLPLLGVKRFKEIGTAEEYVLFEGILRTINGMERFSHAQLAATNQRGEKLSLVVNGSLVFDDDVRAEDAACIVSLSVNGAFFASGEVKAVLEPRVKKMNGFMGSSADFPGLSGFSPADAPGLAADSPVETINTGKYFLI